MSYKYLICEPLNNGYTDASLILPIESKIPITQEIINGMPKTGEMDRFGVKLRDVIEYLDYMLNTSIEIGSPRTLIEDIKNDKYSILKLDSGNY